MVDPGILTYPTVTKDLDGIADTPISKDGSDLVDQNSSSESDRKTSTELKES